MNGTFAVKMIHTLENIPSEPRIYQENGYTSF